MQYETTKAWNLYDGDLIFKKGTTFEVYGVIQDAWEGVVVYARDSITNEPAQFRCKTYRRVLKETVA